MSNECLSRQDTSLLWPAAPVTISDLRDHLSDLALWDLTHRFTMMFTEPHYFSKTSRDPHLLQAFLEPSAHGPGVLPWQRRKRCGHWPGLGPLLPAHPPGNWCSGPCAACGPDTPKIHFMEHELQRVMKKRKKPNGAQLLYRNKIQLD